MYYGVRVKILYVISLFLDIMLYVCVTLQGSGKTILVSRFAAVLGYNVEPIVMYQV